MTQVTSPRSQTKRFLEVFARLGGYIATVAVVEILLRRFSVTSYALLWIPPLLAEVSLLRSKFWNWPYWKGLVARAGSLLLACLIQHYAYAIPVAYRGHEGDAFEEVIWDGFMIVTQAAVAAVALLASRRLLQKKQAVTDFFLIVLSAKLGSHGF
jgi:hypothetical protein